MPLPAPVMSATLSLSLMEKRGLSLFCGGSDAFEVSLAFPVSDRPVVGGCLIAVEVGVVLYNILPERPLRECAFFEHVHGLGKRIGHARQVPGGIDVAHETLRRL